MRQSTWLVLVTTHLALFSFVVLRPLMLDIMAGMDKKDSHVVHPCCSSFLRIWQSLVRCSPAEYRILDFFWVMTSGNVSVFNAYWFNTIHVYVSLRRLLEKFHIFSMSSWTSVGAVLGQGC